MLVSESAWILGERSDAVAHSIVGVVAHLCPGANKQAAAGHTPSWLRVVAQCDAPTQQPPPPLVHGMQWQCDATRICDRSAADDCSRDRASCVWCGIAAPIATILDHAIREPAGGFVDTNPPEQHFAARLQCPEPVPVCRDKLSGAVLARPGALLASHRVDGALTLQRDGVVGPYHQSQHRNDTQTDQP
jgi:hypothetical protein